MKVKNWIKTGTFVVILVTIASTGCRNPTGFLAGPEETEEDLTDPDPISTSATNYAAYYGSLDAEAVRDLAKFDLVIVHPDLNLDLSTDELRRVVRRIQTDGPRTAVIAYISVGEDVRVTQKFTQLEEGGQYVPDWEALKKDRRFYNPDRPTDGPFSGPVIDPRSDAPHPNGAPITTYFDTGDTSGSGGWASYYLDDSDENNAGGGDGRPDFNPNFGSFFVNVGDPTWYTSLQERTRRRDNHYGIDELVGSDADALGFDGLFLDTIDTMGPNSYAAAGSRDNEELLRDDPSRTVAVPSEYEWTAPGLSEFLERVTRDYPDAVIVQNRGLFFLDPRLAHYDHNAGEQVDYVMFESYRLDSRTDVTWTPQYYRENKKRIRQLLMAEARVGSLKDSRETGDSIATRGFEVLSLGYAEGPGAESEVSEDVEEATASGFLHYVTNDALTDIRFDAFDARDPNANPDTTPPKWSSTGYVNLHSGQTAYSEDLIPRVGIQRADAADSDTTELTFDIALDRDPVEYVLYRLDTTELSAEQVPTGDGFTAQATEVMVSPEINRDYAEQYQRGFPVYGAQNEPPPAFTGWVDGFEPGHGYHLLLRARDASGNETDNTELTELAF